MHVYLLADSLALVLAPDMVQVALLFKAVTLMLFTVRAAWR